MSVLVLAENSTLACLKIIKIDRFWFVTKIRSNDGQWLMFWPAHLVGNFKCAALLQNGIEPLSTKDPYRKVKGSDYYGTSLKNTLIS